jgi:SAM-dependent methyltransferase
VNQSRVLDIGCGFCHFLNYLKAKEKVGVDANPLARQFAARDVSVYLTQNLSLSGAAMSISRRKVSDKVALCPFDLDLQQRLKVCPSIE